MQVNLSSTLTILHDGQFWVGICECREGSSYAAYRHVFGAEPHDEDVLAFVCRAWHRIPFRFQDSEAEGPLQRAGAPNPKRAQREARKAVEAARRGVGTKAQQALAASREELKGQRRATSREQREAERQRAFELRALKRKERHRGH